MERRKDTSSYSRNGLGQGILFGLLLICTAVRGQYCILPIGSGEPRIAIDMNYLYNYNQYEKNRWGVGLNIVQSLQHDRRYGSDFQNAFSGDVNVGWGSGDHGWKYGIRGELRFPRWELKKVAIGYMHDLERVGRHDYAAYNILNTLDNSSYISSRYSLIDRLTIGVEVDVPGASYVLMEYRYSDESLLFDGTGALLYPLRYEADKISKRHFDEASLIWWYKGWKVDVVGGRMSGKREGAIGSKDKFYGRIVGQYKNRYAFGDANRLDLYVQGGLTIGGCVPISRRFDVSGSAFSHYYFRNTLLTVRPNTFMADIYTQLSLTYTWTHPLWTKPYSAPQIFVQLNGLWGELRGEKGFDTKGKWYGLHEGEELRGAIVEETAAPDKIYLRSPSHGLLEPVVGIDQLLRWNLIDVGIAAAYQLTPNSSKNEYYQKDFKNKIALMCIAAIVLDTPTNSNKGKRI